MSESISTTPVSTTPPANSPALSLADIQNAVRVIDFACDQGAFKGWQTIEQVLQVRNNLNNFLKAVAPAQTTTATNATPAA